MHIMCNLITNDCEFRGLLTLLRSDGSAIVMDNPDGHFDSSTGVFSGHNIIKSGTGSQAGIHGTGRFEVLNSTGNENFTFRFHYAPEVPEFGGFDGAGVAIVTCIGFAMFMMLRNRFPK